MDKFAKYDFKYAISREKIQKNLKIQKNMYLKNSNLKKKADESQTQISVHNVNY